MSSRQEANIQGDHNVIIQNSGDFAEIAVEISVGKPKLISTIAGLMGSRPRLAIEEKL